MIIEKLLGIVILSLILNGNAYADHKEFGTNYAEKYNFSLVAREMTSYGITDASIQLLHKIDLILI